MRTFYFEAVQSNTDGEGFNWGKFLVGILDTEWGWRTTVQGAVADMPVLQQIGTNPDALWVLDLQTKEGASFAPGGLASADLNKHRIWVCTMYQPFLEWLYEQLSGRRGHKYVELLDQLPSLVELPHAPSAMSGYRRDGRS